MDEKTFNYILKFVHTSDVCLSGVETALDALNKQAKINRKQTLFNFIFGAVAVACVCKINKLINVVNAHNKKINELEAAISKDEQKGE